MNKLLNGHKNINRVYFLNMMWEFLAHDFLVSKKLVQITPLVGCRSMF